MSKFQLGIPANVRQLYSNLIEITVYYRNSRSYFHLLFSLLLIQSNTIKKKAYFVLQIIAFSI